MKNKEKIVTFEMFGKPVEVSAEDEEKFAEEMNSTLIRNQDARLPVLVGYNRIGYIAASNIIANEESVYNWIVFYISDEQKVLSMAESLTGMFNNLFELYDGKIRVYGADLVPSKAFDFSVICGDEIVEVDDCTSIAGDEITVDEELTSWTTFKGV